MTTYPWGGFHDLLPRLDIKSWDLISCISTEARCIGAASNLIKLSNLGEFGGINILPHETHPEISEFKNKVSENKDKMQDLLRSKYSENSFELFEKLGGLYTWYKEFSNGKKNILLDVSCLPKRFFFPLIKFILNDSNIDNFSICYTIPEKYGRIPLSTSAELCQTIPGFNDNSVSNEAVDLVLIGVGYSAMAFPSFLSETCKDSRIELLLPFPPGPPSFQRNWNFIKQINDAFPDNDDISPHRLSAKNVPVIFQQILQLSKNGSRRAWMAPYGPKSMSIAMCLYSCLADNSSVYYTQPKYYSPSYSIGIRQENQFYESYLYPVRIHGENVYAL